jgi:hypothetical protein
MKKIQKMSTCNRLNLETLGSQLIMPKTLPGHLSANLCPPFQTHEHHQDALPYLRDSIACSDDTCKNLHKISFPNFHLEAPCTHRYSISLDDHQVQHNSGNVMKFDAKVREAKMLMELEVHPDGVENANSVE